MKRILALALLLPLVHLNVARADVACSDHGASAQTTESDGPHAGHGAQHDESESGESCEAPAQTECCEAMASCGPAPGCLAASLEANDVSPSIVAEAPPTAAPLAIINAPEPPPPRG